MRPFVGIIILSFLLASCTPDQIVFPSAECFWKDSYSAHPRSADYQQVLDTHTELGLPGVNVLIARPQNDVWIGSSGVARIETNQPLSPCHLMPVGSISKFFCGAAAMLMYEDGILDFDLSVETYLGIESAKSIPNASKAAVGHLLSHTSGIPDYTSQPAFMLDFLNNKDMDMSRETVLDKYVYGKRADFNPGQEYSYSNSNYEIMTLIMDKIYPNGHADYYSYRLFTRLGLNKTFYKNETDYFTLNTFGMANGYQDRNADSRLENATDVSLLIAAGQTGSAGIVSSVSDLYTILSSVFKTDLIKPASLDKMKTYILKKEGITEYLFGLGIVFKDFGEYGSAIGHGGSLPGYTSEAWYFPDSDTYIIYQINAGNMWSGPLEKLIDEVFMGALLGAVFQ